MKKTEPLTEDRLITIWRDFNETEKIILTMQMIRIHEGQRRYGKWQRGDGRRYKKEALEEMLDFSNYTSMDLYEMELDDE